MASTGIDPSHTKMKMKFNIGSDWYTSHKSGAYHGELVFDVKWDWKTVLNEKFDCNCALGGRYARV